MRRKRSRKVVVIGPASVSIAIRRYHTRSIGQGSEGNEAYYISKLCRPCTFRLNALPRSFLYGTMRMHPPTSRHVQVGVLFSQVHVGVCVLFSWQICLHQPHYRPIPRPTCDIGGCDLASKADTLWTSIQRKSLQAPPSTVRREVPQAALRVRESIQMDARGSFPLPDWYLKARRAATVWGRKTTMRMMTGGSSLGSRELVTSVDSRRSVTLHEERAGRTGIES